MEILEVVFSGTILYFTTLSDGERLTRITCLMPMGFIIHITEVFIQVTDSIGTINTMGLTSTMAIT